MLNANFIRLFTEREAIVPGAVEVLVTACAVLQLIAVTRANGKLLGYTVGKDGFAGLNCVTSYNHIINIINQSCKHNAHHKLILCEKRKVLLRWVMARSAA